MGAASRSRSKFGNHWLVTSNAAMFWMGQDLAICSDRYVFSKKKKK